MTSNFNFSQSVTVIVFPLLSVSLGILLWKMYKYKIYNSVGVVKKLYFYPVKSLKRVEVEQLECTPIGVKANGIIDRSFMLIDGDHVLVSQRQEPRLTLLTTDLTDKHIVITNPEGKGILTLDISESENKFDNVITCRVHDCEIDTVDCGEVAAKYFNDFLGRKDIRLVRYVSYVPKSRYVGKDPVFANIFKTPCTLQDLAPVNLLTESSVDALNSNLKEKVSENNFRPNVFITGSLPFDEDNWRYIKFSSGAEIESMLPCGRCLITTNDPETGIKTNKEPLATLRKFRMLKDSKSADAKVIRSPCFAVNCWVRKVGFVSVGDSVSATIEKDRLTF